MIFLCKNLLLSQYRPEQHSVSLNLLIIHWSLSKNMANQAKEQSSMFRIESCAKQQILIDSVS